MKVAHITTIDMSLRYLLLGQLTSLRDIGYVVYGISSPGKDVSVVEAAGIHHIAVNVTRTISPLADLKTLFVLWCILRKEKFTIVHTHTPKPGLLGQIAARLARVPIVINTLHGFYFHEHMPVSQRRFYVWMERIAALASDVILSQNSEDIQTAIREKICSPQKIKLLGNGIDLKRFSRESINLEVLETKRRELNLAPNRPVVGFVGRLVAEKGILEFLAAMKLVYKHIPDVQILIVGPIDSVKKDSLSPDIARAYSLEQITLFTGLRDDMPYMYALMNVFVLPSHREGYPRSLMEASAMKVPSIATDIRGCREAVSHNLNGLLVPLGDIAALAHAIISVLENKPLAHKLCENARKVALERFDEHQVFTRVHQEYTRLLREKNLQ